MKGTNKNTTVSESSYNTEIKSFIGYTGIETSQPIRICIQYLSVIIACTCANSPCWSTIRVESAGIQYFYHSNITTWFKLGQIRIFGSPQSYFLEIINSIDIMTNKPSIAYVPCGTGCKSCQFIFV